MNIFFELSIVIVVAAALSGLMRLFRQPIFLGYILAGLLLGPQFLNFLKSSDTVSVFSQMGTVVLLFIVGLHLSPRELKDLGKNTFIIGILQVGLISLIGFGASRFLGFNLQESIYLGAALSFSSTIITLKLLSDKKDLEKLYSRIAMGILLLQDLIAILALIFSSTLSASKMNLSYFSLLMIKGISLTLLVTLISVYILPKLSSFFARSQEYLFLFSLAWGLGLASLFGYFGFSAEIGALIAGVSLSMTPYSQEISAKLKPLRDFFIVIFFIFLGSKISFGSFASLWLPLVLLLAILLVVKPFVIAVLVKLFGYNERTAFLSGVSLGQLSEFSLILMLLGVKAGQVSSSTFSLITLLGFVSIAISSYLVMYAEKFVPIFLPLLKLFGKKQKIAEGDFGPKIYDAVLFGCNRAGYDFVKMFSAFGEKFLAVDFNPEIIKELKEKGINCVYGDAEDGDFLDEIGIERARIIVSTIPEYETNLYLITKIRSENRDAIVLLVSYNIEEAIKLYEKGATYVILPHFIGGEFAARLTAEAGFDITKLHGKRDAHIRYLKERKALGHAHPVWNHS